MFQRFRNYIERVAEKEAKSGKSLSDEKFYQLRQLKADVIRYWLENVTKEVEDLLIDEAFEEPFADPPIQKPLDYLSVKYIIENIDSGLSDKSKYDQSVGFKDKDLIYNLYYISDDSYVPPMFRDMWYEFYQLQLEVLTLYVYYKIQFDRSIAALDSLLDFPLIQLLGTLNDCNNALRQKRHHIERTSKSTMVHQTRKDERKEKVLQYYNRIEHRPISLWGKAKLIQNRLGAQAPSRRTIYNYLVEEGKADTKKD